MKKKKSNNALVYRYQGKSVSKKHTAYLTFSTTDSNNNIIHSNSNSNNSKNNSSFLTAHSSPSTSVSFLNPSLDSSFHEVEETKSEHAIRNMCEITSSDAAGTVVADNQPCMCFEAMRVAKIMLDAKHNKHSLQNVYNSNSISGTV
uniref:Uncharacterized protein n=1 Tax=Lygus hesperus TaxID=30085 RepID=A0A0A9YME4_LYGHE